MLEAGGNAAISQGRARPQMAVSALADTVTRTPPAGSLPSMPRSVRVAVATACVVATLGAFSLVVLAIDLLTDHSASAALGTRAFGSFVNPLLAMAINVPRAAVKRDERLRELSFHFALLMAMLLGFVALFTLVPAFMGGGDADLVLSWSVFLLAVVLAWSLSRPTAKAWFTSAPVLPSRPA